MLESCINKTTDGVSTDPEGNFIVQRGLQLGNSTVSVPGGLRFNGTQLQVFTGGSWTSLTTGGAGPFTQFSSTAVAFATPLASGACVGIGPFNGTTALPGYRFDVPLDVNTPTGTTQQVRFGNIVCSNGQGLNGMQNAQISHIGFATDAGYALRQASNGSTTINAAAGRTIIFSQAGSSTRMGISINGNVIIGGSGDTPAAGPAILQVAGLAWKNNGVATWDNTSDARCKDDVRDLETGLAELRKVRPVRYRYNGRAGTPAGLAGIGVLGQEIETVLPETVRRIENAPAGEPDLDNLRVFNAHALTFVLINAVKELAAKVDQLEQALASAGGNPQGAAV